MKQVKIHTTAENKILYIGTSILAKNTYKLNIEA